MKERSVIIAADSPPVNQAELEERGMRHRIEYLALAKETDAKVVNFNTSPSWTRKTGHRMLHPGLAWHGLTEASRNHTSSVLYMSESTGMPAALFSEAREKFGIERGKSIVIFHNPLSPRKVELLKRFPQIIKNIDNPLFLSRSEADTMSTIFNSKDNFDVQYAPIDTQFYQPQNRSNENIPPHILSMGVSHRDYPLLIQAVAKLPEVNCVISATTVSDVVKVTYGNTMPPNVTKAEYNNPLSVRSQFDACTFGIVPIDPHTTQISAGCTTVSLLQSMGKAVIATRNEGLKDYMRDGETGIMVKPGDEDEMRQAIEYLWKNPDVASEMGRKGRQFVEHPFCIDAWVDDMMVNHLSKDR